MRPAVNKGVPVTIVGFGLVAVTYGLIRCSYGQFMPAVRAELGLSESMAGLVSASLFLGNCASLLVAALATERYGGRAVAGLAGILATIGLLGMAFATNPIAFASWLMLAGSSAGLSMPPLVAAIVSTVKEDRRALSTTIVNAGTSLGIIISGPIAIYFSGIWRFSFLGFAVIALGTTLAVFAVLPKNEPNHNVTQSLDSFPIWKRRATYPLMFSAFLFGLVCATFWAFGGEILATSGGWTSQGISWFWVIIGFAGLAGAPSGIAVHAFGVRTVHMFSFLMIAAAVILLGLATDHMAFPIIAAAIFGALYILLSGLYLVWGLQIAPDRPAVIVAAAFFMLPLGQVFGSILIGAGIEWLGTKETLFCVVLVCLIAAVPIHVGQKGSANNVAIA